MANTHTVVLLNGSNWETFEYRVCRLGLARLAVGWLFVTRNESQCCQLRVYRHPVLDRNRTRDADLCLMDCRRHPWLPWNDNFYRLLQSYAAKHWDQCQSGWRSKQPSYYDCKLMAYPVDE